MELSDILLKFTEVRNLITSPASDVLDRLSEVLGRLHSAVEDTTKWLRNVKMLSGKPLTEGEEPISLRKAKGKVPKAVQKEVKDEDRFGSEIKRLEGLHFEVRKMAAHQPATLMLAQRNSKGLLPPHLQVNLAKITATLVETLLAEVRKAIEPNEETPAST